MERLGGKGDKAYRTGIRLRSGLWRDKSYGAIFVVSGVERFACAMSDLKLFSAHMIATAYRYLVNLPGVCQGRTIVEGTRLGVQASVSPHYLHF